MKILCILFLAIFRNAEKAAEFTFEGLDNEGHVLGINCAWSYVHT
jgi:hypothetical protein